VAGEFRQSQAANAERPEALVTLGAFEARLGRADVAEAAYRTSIQLQPQFAPAYVNLADLLRATGRDAEGAQVLRDGLGAVPANGRPSLQHALGLHLVRAKRYADAMVWLRQAAEGDAGNARYAFVYGVALHDTGQAAEGRRVPKGPPAVTRATPTSWARWWPSAGRPAMTPPPGAGPRPSRRRGGRRGCDRAERLH
jgi:Flp pilus assembly protein TadD